MSGELDFDVDGQQESEGTKSARSPPAHPGTSSTPTNDVAGSQLEEEGLSVGTSKGNRSTGPIGSDLGRGKKTVALNGRLTAKEIAHLEKLVHGAEMISNETMVRLKRGRHERDGTDSENNIGRYRRAKMDEGFNAASLIGSIFLRVQGNKAPAPLVYFDDDINCPMWFKESIDGVQPCNNPAPDFEQDQVTLESMGKLVDGQVQPANLGEVAAYFSHVLGDPRTSKEVTPRVLIAIQCDRAKGWFTYKRDGDNSNFVPVVLCAAEGGRGGLEEVSPAHFEVHRAQCAQKKWRQSFKVLGAQKLHKVTSLAQAALGDVLRHLERILGAEKSRPMDPAAIVAQATNAANARMANGLPLGMQFRRTTPGGSSMMDGHMVDDPRLAMSPEALSMANLHRMGHATPLGAAGMVNGVMRMPPPTSPRVGQQGLLPGARPQQLQPGARGMIAQKPLLRRHTDDLAARPHDAGRGLDLLANAASNAGLTSPRNGLPALPAGVPAGLLASALGGISFTELMQLVIDNNARRQHHQQQQQLLAQLAQMQKQQQMAEQLQLKAAASGVNPAAAAAGAGSATAGGAAGAVAQQDPLVGAASTAALAIPPPGIVHNPVLSAAEREAITAIMTGVRGMDVAHAVRGILQHVAMQHAGENPLSEATAPALATALTTAAAAEGMNLEVPKPAEASNAEAGAAAAAEDAGAAAMDVDAAAALLQANGDVEGDASGEQQADDEQQQPAVAADAATA